MRASQRNDVKSTRDSLGVGRQEHRRIKPPLRLHKDPRYSALYRIYLQLRDNSKRDKSTQKHTYPYLGTAKLMEVYTVCLFVDMLQEESWSWVSGWVAGFGGDLRHLVSVSRAGARRTPGRILCLTLRPNWRCKVKIL